MENMSLHGCVSLVSKIDGMVGHRAGALKLAPRWQPTTTCESFFRSHRQSLIFFYPRLYRDEHFNNKKTNVSASDRADRWVPGESQVTCDCYKDIPFEFSRQTSHSRFTHLFSQIYAVSAAKLL